MDHSANSINRRRLFLQDIENSIHNRDDDKAAARIGRYALEEVQRLQGILDATSEALQWFWENGDAVCCLGMEEYSKIYAAVKLLNDSGVREISMDSYLDPATEGRVP